MADAYGTIIVCGDYEGDLDAIAEVLDSLKLNQSDVQFSVYADEGVHRPGWRWSSIPDRLSTLYDADEDGDLSELEEYSLEQLSGLISPLLMKGTIELVAVATEKDRYAYYGPTHHSIRWFEPNCIAICQALKGKF